MLAVLQSLSGSLGINQSSSTAPSTVPDYAPSFGGATGGDSGMKLHNVDSQSRSSGVSALDTSAMSMSPVLRSYLSHVFPSSARHYIDLGNVQAAPVAAPVGHPPPPLASSGDDQLRVPCHGPLHSSSSSLSPTSLLFPLTPSLPVPPPSSSALLCPPLSASSSSGTLPSLSSSSAVPSHYSSSSSSFSFSALLTPYPSVTPSLSSASFPSSSFVTPSLPPLISSSVSSSFYPPVTSSFFPALQSSVSPPPGFPPSSSSASSSSSSSFPPLSLSSSSSSSFFPPAAPPPPPPPLAFASSSSSFGSLPSSALVDHQVQLLGLSSDYQSLARWFVTSGVTDFAGLVRSSFPHLLPDLARDFTSGSFLFLTTLCSVSPPSQAPSSSSVSSTASYPPLSAHLSSASIHGVPPYPSSSSQSLPFAPPGSSSLPPPPGFSHPPSSLAFPIQGSSVVHGLGMGVPPSSGVTSSPFYSSAATAYAASAPASWHPPSAYPPDTFAPTTPPPSISNPLSS